LRPQRSTTDLIQVIGVLELPLAAITVIGRMCLILMLFEFLLGFEDTLAVLARVPMLALLVLKTKLSGMCRPTSVTPSALDLIIMLGAVIEVVAHAIGIEITTAAFGHD